MARHKGDTKKVVKTRATHVIELRKMGLSTTSIARVMDLTPGGVSIILKREAPDLTGDVVSRSVYMKRWWKKRKASLKG